MKMSKKFSFLIIFLLIAAGVASRFMPHAWNMTPIVAISLFASVYFGIRYSLFTVGATMLISDLFIGFYDLRIMLSVYAGFAVASLIGLLVRKHKTAVSVLLGAASSSAFFFVLTNWAVWQFGTMYERSAAGLLESFAMALPFFKNMLIGDVVYSAILFGAYELALAFSQKLKLRASSEKIYLEKV
ncbi:MAG: hypothetical protein HY432_03145 [Candidatus Liptonbacteria bacterium]|nr:hypothetical protein [Candidatus Liptonbacteria bacterium]